MPNFVMNRVFAKGSKQDLCDLKKLISESVNHKIDFNKVIPMPPTLNIVDGSCKALALAAYHIASGGAKADNLLDQRELERLDELRADYVRKTGSDRISDEELDSYIKQRDMGLSPDNEFFSFAAYGKIYFYNRTEYGCFSWYDWCTDNWGTKWNAECGSIEEIEDLPDGNGTLSFSFQTAWSMPLPIFQKLSVMFPAVLFHVFYADEDIGSNCGVLIIGTGQNSNMTEMDMNDSDAFAEAVWNLSVNDLMSLESQKKNKVADRKVHGVYADSNWGGIEISLVDGASYLYWRQNYGTPKKWHRAKIQQTMGGKPFFVARGLRVHLDTVMRV